MAPCRPDHCQLFLHFIQPDPLRLEVRRRLIRVGLQFVLQLTQHLRDHVELRLGDGGHDRELLVEGLGHLGLGLLQSLAGGLLDGALELALDFGLLVEDGAKQLAGPLPRPDRARPAWTS